LTLSDSCEAAKEQHKKEPREKSHRDAMPDCNAPVAVGHQREKAKTDYNPYGFVLLYDLGQGRRIAVISMNEASPNR
jgi:hypothetical protein